MGKLQRGSIGLFVFLAVFAPIAAHAQDGPGLGIGPRVTFQTGDAAVPNSSVLRVLGGQLKLRLTSKTEVELSADYQSSLDATLRERVKSLPLQASLLVFPIRSVVSPYVLGGVGWYRQSIFNGGDTIAIREMGLHGGVGAEVRVGKRIAIHGDYRYNHIRFGDPASPGQATSSAAVSPSTVATAISLLPKLTALQESLKMSHQGSMWNWGLTFFF
jgi:opacity protein-like surface antigen